MWRCDQCFITVADHELCGSCWGGKPLDSAFCALHNQAVTTCACEDDGEGFFEV